MPKTRISMTISADVLSRLDDVVDGKNIRSRSEAIEGILRQHMESNKTAVFLGGGDPGRLKIDGVFRPLVRIRGKCLIEHNIDALRKCGFRRMLIIGRNELVGECFKVLGNGSRYRVDIKYIEEEKTLGNAKTLQLGESGLSSSFLVLPVDNFFDFDLDYLSKVHVENNGTITLAVQAGRDSDSRTGVVEMAGSRIVTYEEKPLRPKTFLTATFIGMYRPEVFEYIPKGNVKWVLQTDLFPRMIAEGGLNGCIVHGTYFNIHSHEDLKKLSITKVLPGNK